MCSRADDERTPLDVFDCDVIAIGDGPDSRPLRRFSRMSRRRVENIRIGGDGDRGSHGTRVYDNPGNRQFLIRQMLFKSLGIPDQDEMFVSHQFLWRGSRRACDVLFTNVRGLPDESLRSADDWKLVIDFPFDAEGHTPTEDVDRLDKFRDKNEKNRTLVWLPAFFSPRTQAELGKLVVIDRLLLGTSLDQHAKHLSLQDRQTARLLLQNQQSALSQRLLQAVEAAYAIRSEPTPGTLDASFDMADSHFQSLYPTLALQRPVGADLGEPDGLRTSLGRRLVNGLGDAADSVLRFMDSGAGADALALAVACQVVFGGGDGKTLAAAAARMEQYHRHKPISQGVGRALGRVAGDAIADLDRREDPRVAQQHLQRADELLRQFRCEDHAHRNGLTLLGYEQRLARFGTQIEAVLDAPGEAATDACDKFQQEVASHRIAKLGRRVEQVSRTEMALRLVRWLADPVPPAASFAEVVNVYRTDLSFVDWARESICRGEDVAGLSKAYQRLDQTVLARRHEFNRAFASSLADWTSTGSTADDICGVEDVLSRVVAEVAGADNRVLLIVLDGMSWAVCHELLEDVRRDHWFEATTDGAASPPVPVIAAIPSVTSYSRTSLLSGKLERGDAAVEKRNFEANPSLRQCCDKRYPPLLFHKKDVSEGTRGVVGDDLSRAVLSPNNRVVGVVINAIDDFLSKGDQMPMLWSLGRINHLGSLLKLARDSGRVVVLASDHGHVWHRPDAKSFPSDEGSRWRGPSTGRLGTARWS